MTELKYSHEGDNRFTVLRGASHRLGMVEKIGFRWLAIAPANHLLGSFASMSEAGSRLVEEDEKK